MTDLPPANHKFWNTQPVVQAGERPKEQGIIDQVTTIEMVSKDPSPLPPGFEWCLIDTTEPVQCEELYEFLRNHYVTHPQNTFRFAYSKEFLDWALHPPGWVSDWHLGVRFGEKKQLVAFISGIPITVKAGNEIMNIACVDFLSVHGKLRNKNLAPVLIKEITRRINLRGIFQAIYTAGRKLTQPYTEARYYHRLVNYKKLLSIGFTSLKPGEKLDKVAKSHMVPSKTHLPGLRIMEEKDIPTVTLQLNEFQKKYTVGTQFSEAEVRHWLMPRDKIVGSFVIEDEKTKEVVSFFSFYIVPSTVLGNSEYNEYTAAYFYYYFSRPSLLADVGRAAIEIAVHQYKADVVNCLDICDNGDILSQLRFVPGDGQLNYYLYNYAMPPMPPGQNGVILL